MPRIRRERGCVDEIEKAHPDVLILGGEVLDGTTVPISRAGSGLVIAGREVAGGEAPNAAGTRSGRIVSFPEGA